MIKITRGQTIYLVVVMGLLAYYGVAEARGWASGGTKRPPVAQSHLRQSGIGYRNHLFWYHGFRGK